MEDTRMNILAKLASVIGALLFFALVVVVGWRSSITSNPAMKKVLEEHHSIFERFVNHDVARLQVKFH
jgi:hypothetical protein